MPWEVAWALAGGAAGLDGGLGTTGSAQALSFEAGLAPAVGMTLDQMLRSAPAASTNTVAAPAPRPLGAAATQDEAGWGRGCL